MVTPTESQTQTPTLTSSIVLDVLNVSDSENASDHESNSLLTV